ncbi:glycosyltransferase [Cutibacterium acnes JCM 18909]|nr:glycosyltransferase [Cutibacterium acnes JCM 18909]
MTQRLQDFHAQCDPDDLENTNRLLPSRRSVWLGQLTVTPGICLIGSTRGAMRMERQSTISLATTSPSAITVLSSIRTLPWSAL